MKTIKSAYLIGIKGVGMTALALYLKQAGIEVTGSDVAEVFVTDKLLKSAGIVYFSKFSAQNLKGKKYDLIIVSAAYDQKNPEVAEGRKRRLNLKYYSDVLGEISADKKVIAVSGIHGKTTTSAMISYLLEKAELSPSYIIGSGKVPNLKSNAQKGNGDYFVLEADEYRKSPQDKASKFLNLNPQIAVITSIEMDHPDIFATVEDVYDAFYRLVCKVPRNGFIVICTDYPKTKKLSQTIADRNFETYGMNPLANWRITDISENSTGSIFSLINNNKSYGPFQLKIIGIHNILNATAAIITALLLEVPEKTISKYIAQFQNVKRRLEKIGESNNNIIILDDYAHHPTAIKLTLEAIKNKYPKHKIYCIFQPHTYSRTEKLLNEFAKAFNDADKIFITDIFASTREQTGNVTAVNLVDKIKKNHGNVKLADNWEKLEDYLIEQIKGPAIIITIGAGNIYKLAKDLKTRICKEK